MTSRPRLSILRGDIWLIAFDPTIGDEIQKTRPAVIMSVHSAYQHKLQIVVPLTSWQPKFSGDFWMIYMPMTPSNGLDKHSAANTFQVKSVSEHRFLRKLGVATADQIDEIAASITLCIGYNPPVS